MDLASKQYVRTLLVDGVAEFIPINEITRGPWRHNKSTKSDVWNRFGPVRIIATGMHCEGLVACNQCYKIYTFKGSSQGTSTLRFHQCIPEEIVVKQVAVDVEIIEEEGKNLCHKFSYISPLLLMPPFCFHNLVFLVSEK